MRTFILVSLFFLMTIAFAPIAQADEKTCASLKHIKPTSSVLFSLSDPLYDHETTRQQLNIGMEEHHEQWLKEHGLEKTISVGAMSTEGLHTMGHGVDFRNIQMVPRDFDKEANPRTSCIYFKNIDVLLTAESLITIPSEYSPGTCKYNHILEHEKKHYKVGEGVMVELNQKLRAEMPKLMEKAEAQSKPVPIKEEKDEAHRIAKILRDLILDYIKANSADDLKSRNAWVDSPEEYAATSKLMAACGN